MPCDGVGFGAGFIINERIKVHPMAVLLHPERITDAAERIGKPCRWIYRRGQLLLKNGRGCRHHRGSLLSAPLSSRAPVRLQEQIRAARS
jgi:hypothetical protein